MIMSGTAVRAVSASAIQNVRSTAVVAAGGSPRPRRKTAPRIAVAELDAIRAIETTPVLQTLKEL